MRTGLSKGFLMALCLAVLPAIAQMSAGAADAHWPAAGLNPDPLPDLMGMGRILAFRGNLAGSTMKFREAVRLYPTNAEANVELGLNLMLSGQTNEAARCFTTAMQLEPGLAEQNKRTAKALMNNGQPEPARRRLILACCLKPEDVEARLTLAFCLKPNEAKAAEYPGTFSRYLARLDEAFYIFEKTLPSRPAAAAYDHLGSAFASNRMFVEAVQEYREAVRTHPNDASALDTMAWSLATCPKPELRNGREAVQLATRAVELTGEKQPAFIGTLAAAYAEDGQFSKAIEMAKKARELALSVGQPEVAARNELLLKLYSAGKTVNAANGP
jgi:Flp pilus assembly protein TadD